MKFGLPRWRWWYKEPTCLSGFIKDAGSIPRSGRFFGEGHGNPLQYSCQKNPTVREAWRATVYGVARVGHDLATTRPPPIKSRKIFPCQGQLISKQFHLQP